MLITIPSNVSFIDALIDEQGGIPFGLWIQLQGPVGSGKSTLGMQILHGFNKYNSDKVETWHCDFEMREFLAHRVYESIGAPLNANYCNPKHPEALLDRIYERADELLPQAISLVVLVDAFQALVPDLNLKKQIALATRIKDNWDKHPNLLLISVNHINKRGQTGGAAQIAQLCDVQINVHKKYGFTYISSPKNRAQAAHAPESIKLTRVQGEGFVQSSEPDFISSLPLVVWGREQLAKSRRK